LITNTANASARKDAQLILRLMFEDRFRQIWVPSWENRDLRQLLWHRHPNGTGTDADDESVVSRGSERRLMLQEEVVAGSRTGTTGGIFKLAPWASQRRRDLLEVLDRLNPTIAKLTQAIEESVEVCRGATLEDASPGWVH
jgi:transposase